MIYISYCESIEDQRLKDRVIEYINHNIQEAFLVARDKLADLDDYTVHEIIGYHNLDLTDEQLDEIFRTSFDIVVSQSIRYRILPKYQYMIFYVIEWWVEIHEDDEIPIVPLSDDLANRIGEYILDVDELSHFIDTITDMTRYSEIVFEDWDFLPSYLDDMVQLYIKNEPLFHIAFPDVDLKDYIPVMSKDIKELYVEYVSKSQAEQDSESPLSLHLKLVRDIIRACETVQNDKDAKKYSEDQINTHIRNALQFTGYTVRDQTLTGESSTGIGAGEADIQVFFDRIPSCIVEGLILTSLNKPYLSEHIDRIFKYDTRGNLANIILSYVKVKDFCQFWDNYQSYVKNYQYDKMKSLDYVNLSFSNGTETKCSVSVLERSGSPTFLFHIAVHIHV